MQAKRWLSGLVACAMLVTMLPTQVFALESDAADTWSKTLNAEELYALIQDKLDENGSIGLADLADSEAGTDTNDGVQGTLTAVAFDSGDKIELSALADGDTSYTLTFTDDDTSEPDSSLPAETGDMTEPPQEDGQPVAPGATPADDSIASDTTSGTDPPTAEEPSAQGQEGTVDLRVTTQETYATEAEADAQAAEQGKDPEADVAVQTDEATGTVLGAMLTVDEEQVDAVTLYYTADEAEDDAETQDNEEPQAEDGTPTEEPAGLEGTNALQTANWEPSITIEVDETIGEKELKRYLPDSAEINTISSEDDKGIVDIGKTGHIKSWQIEGIREGDETVSIEYTIPGHWEGGWHGYWVPEEEGTQRIKIIVTRKDWGIDIPTGSDVTAAGAEASATKQAIPGDNGTWNITMDASITVDSEPQELELVLLFDRSGSMEYDVWSDDQPDPVFEGERQEVAAEAAREVLTRLRDRGLNAKVAIAEFSGYRDARVTTKLTSIDQLDLKSAIPDSGADGGTYMYPGLKAAVGAFSKSKNQKAIIMLADGESSDFSGTDTKDAEAFAEAISEQNISIYTIGFAENVSSLENIGIDGYYQANDLEELTNAFTSIANELSAMVTDDVGSDVEIAQDNVRVTVNGDNAETVTVETIPGEEDHDFFAWNPEDTIQADEPIQVQYTVQPKDPKVGYNTIDLNGKATLTYSPEGSEEDKFKDFNVPTGFYSAGRLNQEFKTENGAEISAAKIGNIQYLSWGVKDGDSKNGVTNFTWNAPGELENNGTTYYYQYSYLASDPDTPIEENSTEAKPAVVTVVHVYSEKKPLTDSQIKVEVYLDGAENAESDSSTYVNVYNTKNGSNTEVSREEGNLYKFQYEQYDSMDTRITLEENSPYVIDAVETSVIHGEKGFNANESEVHPTEAVIDNVAGLTTYGNNVVKVYLRTKYSVAYYRDNTLLTDDEYDDKGVYVESRKFDANVATDYSQYTNTNNDTPTSTQVQSSGLSTTISLKALPEVGVDQTISGWFANEDVTSGESTYPPENAVNVSDHKDRADKQKVIPFYARTAAATATLIVQAVNEEGEPLTVDDQLPQSVQVTIDTPYTVAIGTSAGATITAPMDFTANDTHYAYMKLGKNSAALTDTMTADGATVTLVYGVDEIGGKDPDKPNGGPDGTPDAYQATVTYKVVNGTWEDGTAVAKTEVVDLYEWIETTDTWKLIPNPTLQNVPTNMVANSGYLQSSGKWDNEPTADDLEPGGTAIFTYTFTDTVKKITSVAKELLTETPEGLTLPGDITLPEYNEAKEYFTVDADATQVSLLYQITVEGDVGAAFTLTDTPTGDNTTIQYWNGLSWSNEVISGTLADTSATYYVLVTYTPSFTDGVVMIGANTVTVAPGDGDTTTVPEKPTASTDPTEVRKNFTVSYKFVSDTDDMELPSEVTALLPTLNPKTVTAHDKVNLDKVPETGLVSAEGGTWQFVNWYIGEPSETNPPISGDEEITSNTTFIGHWKFVSDMPTVQDVISSYKKTVITQKTGATFEPVSFQFKLEKQQTDGTWQEVKGLTYELDGKTFSKLSTVSVSQAVEDLTIAGCSEVLIPGTYRLTELPVAEQYWEPNTQEFVFTVTDNGEVQSTKEAKVFVNTYIGPQIGTDKDPEDPGQDIPTTDQAPTKTPVTKAEFEALDLTPVNETIWNALSAQTVWPVQDADNWSLTVPAGEESTTYVLYDVAINGDIGAEFTVTDADATLVAYQGATLSADNSYYTLDATTAHFYFAKKADQTQDGILKNVAIVTDKNNPGEEPGGKDPVPDPEAPDIPVITEGVTAEKHVVTSPEGISLEGVNVKYPVDGTVTIAKPDDENAVLLYAVTVKGAANANFTLTEEPYVVYIPSDDGTTLTPNGNGNTYTGTLPADGEATFYFTKPITGEGKMKNTVVLNDDTSNPIESGETEIIETKDPTDPENPGYVTITFYEGNHGTLSKDTDDNGVYTVTIERGSRLTPDNLTDVLADAGYYFTGWQNANRTYSESELLDLTFVSDTAFTAQYQTMPNQIIVNYDDDGSGYGEVTSEHRQVFTADNWKTITDDPTHVRIHLTATAEDDGGRTYFDEWQGSLVDDLDDDIREDEELSAWVVAEIGQTYTVIADFGRRSSGGGGGGGNRDDDDDTEEIIDEEVPLAETPWLNTVDHYAYIVGYAEDGTVRPNANITRAEVATIFFRLLTDEARNSLWSTTNTFSDVASTAWYNTAVSTMANAGIIQGYEDGTFRPNANITRAEFAAIAARFMTSGYDVESDLFTDIAGHWARESINDAATAGWINGYSDDTFRPDNAITRAEAVTLVNNVLQRKPDADHMLDSMITWPDNPESAWYYEAIQEATNSHDYDMPSEDDDVDYETWTALQKNRDWAALEAQWSAEHAYGGDVM